MLSFCLVQNPSPYLLIQFVPNFVPLLVRSIKENRGQATFYLSHYSFKNSRLPLILSVLETSAIYNITKLLTLLRISQGNGKQKGKTLTNERCNLSRRNTKFLWIVSVTLGKVRGRVDSSSAGTPHKAHGSFPVFGRKRKQSFKWNEAVYIDLGIQFACYICTKNTIQ